MDDEEIAIDGAYGEGGGQVVRTCLSLSSISGKRVRISNIRAGRSRAGLRPQHVAAARAVRSICRGTVEGAHEGSSGIAFSPGEIHGGKYEFNIGTAGSAVLLAQAVLPVLFSASKKSLVRISGGTNVPKSPTYEYFEKVFLPALRCFGLEASCSMKRAGYFPTGGGEIELEVTPSSPEPSRCWPREQRVKALISLSGLPPGIGLREKKVFLNSGVEQVYMRGPPSSSKGNSVLAYRGLVGSAVLGSRGVRAEEVAARAVSALREEGDVDVDHNLADQLLIYAALAGKTTFKTSFISMHSETNMHVIEKFLGKKFSRSGAEIRVD